MEDIKNISLLSKVSDIMTSDFVHISPNTLMKEVEEIFNRNSFHHIPVLNESGAAVGIISKSDYHMLLHHFTLLKYKEAVQRNNQFFRSLIAEDIMVRNPICIKEGTTIKEVLKMFLVNKFHCLLVTSGEKCSGIVTPYDFLELLADAQNSEYA